jgi:hypothetical protein
MNDEFLPLHISLFTCVHVLCTLCAVPGSLSMVAEKILIETESAFSESEADFSFTCVRVYLRL